MKKYLPFLFLVTTLVSLVIYPVITPTFGLITLLLSLAFSTYGIYTKHAGTENARAKILKEIGVMVLTLVIILFLGGIAAVLANYQVSMRWGKVAGWVSAIGASFVVGYLVRKGMMKLSD
jgi:fructose-specific phosphotransferase system IIC component